MVSGRTLLVLAALAGGLWLWQSGHWRLVAERLAGAPAQLAASLPAPAEAPPARPPEPLYTWVDGDGVRHYGSGREAPPGSTPVQPSAPAGEAAYLRELERERGISARDLERARREPTPAPTPGPSPTSPPPAGDTATAQAYELMHNLEQKLEHIRRENNR